MIGLVSLTFFVFVDGEREGASLGPAIDFSTLVNGALGEDFGFFVGGLDGGHGLGFDSEFLNWFASLLSASELTNFAPVPSSDG